MTDTTPAPKMSDMLTREDWLHRAADEFRGWILEVSGIAVPDVHLSVGLGARKYEDGVRGVCWPRAASADARSHAFISPEVDDTAEVLAIVLHLMIHAALDSASDPKWDGHRGKFVEYAMRCGLVAPYTTSTPDITTAAQMMTIAHDLGPYPHARLTVRQPKAAQVPDGEPVTVGGGGTRTSAGGPQKNRWISFTCPTHGDPVRMSRTKAGRGAPLCGVDVDGMPCATRMEEK